MPVQGFAAWLPAQGASSAGAASRAAPKMRRTRSRPDRHARIDASVTIMWNDSMMPAFRLSLAGRRSPRTGVPRQLSSPWCITLLVVALMAAGPAPSRRQVGGSTEAVVVRGATVGISLLSMAASPLLVVRLGTPGQPAPDLTAAEVARSLGEMLDRLQDRHALPDRFTIQLGPLEQFVLAALQARLTQPGANWNIRTGNVRHGSAYAVLPNEALAAMEGTPLAEPFTSRGFHLSVWLGRRACRDRPGGRPRNGKAANGDRLLADRSGAIERVIAPAAPRGITRPPPPGRAKRARTAAARHAAPRAGGWISAPRSRLGTAAPAAALPAGGWTPATAARSLRRW